jgi:hypothetical protein
MGTIRLARAWPIWRNLGPEATDFPVVSALANRAGDVVHLDILQPTRLAGKIKTVPDAKADSENRTFAVPAAADRPEYTLRGRS